MSRSRNAPSLKPPPYANAETHRRIIEKLAEMTPKEILETSIASGIHTKSGLEANEMGCSLSWIAFKGIGSDTVLARLGREDTTTKVMSGEGYTAGGALAGGFYLVLLDECFHRLLDPESLARLSTGCTLIACQAEEHVMVSACFRWIDGSRSFQVTHSSENGMYDLEAEGDAPAEFAGLREQAVARQDADGGKDADVDYLFSVPVDVAAALVGFHHDRAMRTNFAPPWTSFTRLDPAAG